MHSIPISEDAVCTTSTGERTSGQSEGGLVTDAGVGGGPGEIEGGTGAVLTARVLNARLFAIIIAIVNGWSKWSMVVDGMQNAAGRGKGSGLVLGLASVLRGVLSGPRWRRMSSRSDWCSN